MTILKSYAQKKIALTWFINVGILIIIFILFTALGRFDSKVSEGWGWLAQNTIPMLTLMVSTFVENQKAINSKKKIDVFYFRLCNRMSLFFFALLYFTILLAPLAFRFSHLSIIDFFDKSKIYLALVQGVLTYCLGLFFTKES